MISRKKEILELVKVISKGNNALVYGHLFSGKTSFLKQLTVDFDNEKVTYFYIDCKKCFDERSFLSEYSKEGLRVLSGQVAGAVKDAFQILPNIKPSISSSGSKGAELSMSYGFTSDDMTKFTLDVLQAPYRISNSRGEQVVVILDDYDYLLTIEILKFHDFISKSNDQGVVYILSTADQDLFLSISKKEQKNLHVDLIHVLDKTTEAQCHKYINDQFTDLEIEEGAIEFLMSAVSGDIKAISEFINYYGKNELTIRAIRRTINSILARKEHTFQIFFDSLSVHQKKLIVALAKHSGKHVFKGQFIYNNGLISVPSVQTSIKGLIKKQFIHKDVDGMKFTDVFFGEWLRRSF